MSSVVFAALLRHSKHCQRRPLSVAAQAHCWSYASTTTLKTREREPQPQQVGWALQNVRAWTTDSSKTKTTQKEGKKNHKNHRKKKKKNPTASGQAGRVVVVHQAGSGRVGGSKSGGVKQCGGCGSQIISSGNNRGGSRSTQMMFGGAAAAEATADSNLTKKQQKAGRYFDVSDLVRNKTSGSLLCDRCKALQGDDIWKAYDALRDVEPAVFMEQLKYVVQRRRFGLCVVVLDVTDSEHSIVRNLRNAIGSLPIVLVWNKVDLMPRFDPYDQKDLERKASRNLRFINSFAVSSKTGRGLVDLAEHLLEELGGRDVFVVGAANVGKSTMVKKLSGLIAESVYLKGRGKQVAGRREQMSKLQVTGSHLPGTTLQAVRIPCFSSDRHALWDTPGIINPRAVQYHLFPSHLMEPLTRPGRMEVPTRESGRVCRLRPGHSVLIESTWMGGNNGGDVSDEMDDDEYEKVVEEYIKNNTNNSSSNSNNQEECVLARIDLIDMESSERSSSRSSDHVFAQAYLHPSLRLRVVETSLAPDMATIPANHIRRVQQNIRDATGQSETGLADTYSIPLKPFVSPDRPRGDFVPNESMQNMSSGKFYMDIVFASLGWIALTEQNQFSIVPHCVEGSVFSHRKSLYPVNLRPDDALTEVDYLSSTEGELNDSKERIRRAADIGRRRGGQKGGKRRNDYADDFDDDLYF